MKFKNTIYILTVLFISNIINAQVFQDKPGNENTGDFPVKWELIKGSAQIGSFEGSKVILIANKGIINPKLNSKNYLSQSFTLSDYYGATGDYSFVAGHLTRASAEHSTAFGSQNIASGYYSFATGFETAVSGGGSTTMGELTSASGSSSFATGSYTKAEGDVSFAIGQSTIASGYLSIAGGKSSKASGVLSIALIFFTKAKSKYSTAIGLNNIGGGDPTTWRATDPLFEIGNGTCTGKENNAFTVSKNGNIAIGTHKPVVKLQITEGTDASLSAGGYLVIGDRAVENLVFDNNEIMARNNVQPSTLYLQHSGGDVFVGGKVVYSSDFRLKKDIENLSYGLKEILQLRPVSYFWKTNTATEKSIGLIAQEVKPVLKELITADAKNDNSLGVNYTELIPILIKAMQEQQKIINDQNK